MSKKVSIAVFSALGVIIASLAVALIMTVVGRNKIIAELDGLNDQLASEGAELESTLAELQINKASLEAEMASLQTKVADLEEKMTDSGKYYADEIAALKLEISVKNNEIAALEADIAKYQTVFTIDVRAQAQLIDDIERYIATQCPYVRMEKPAQIDEDGNPVETNSEEPEYIWVKVDDLIDEAISAREESSENAEPLFTPEELEASGMTEEELTRSILRRAVLAREDVFYPSVSVYYEDLATGYHYGYNENVPYNSASVIKAPYILSVLRDIAADERAYLDAKEALGEMPEKIDTDDDGILDKTVIEYSDPSYDLSEVVIYDSKTMQKEGSGKIKDMADGTEFTYVDFVKYALEYSDNVAYQQLKNRFGYDRYYALAREVKATSVLRNAVNMTAADAGKLFKAIYEFIEEDETYGKLMYDSMRKGNHTVIIPYGVYPTPTLHKYGWDTDSYHDAAIVLNGDKPYILTVFTDLDNGGDDVNAYLRQIVKLVNKLHKGFYQS